MKTGDFQSAYVSYVSEPPEESMEILDFAQFSLWRSLEPFCIFIPGL